VTPDDFSQDVQRLIEELNRLQCLYAFGYDASNHMRRLIASLGEELAELDR
jgi:hypothetical protein